MCISELVSPKTSSENSPWCPGFQEQLRRSSSRVPPRLRYNQGARTLSTMRPHNPAVTIPDWVRLHGFFRRSDVGDTTLGTRLFFCRSRHTQCADGVLAYASWVRDSQAQHLTMQCRVDKQVFAMAFRQWQSLCSLNEVLWICLIAKTIDALLWLTG